MRCVDTTLIASITVEMLSGKGGKEHIELPFFLYYLKGRGDGKLPKARVFQTGMNQWRKFDTHGRV
jgi:hypothetical protein